MAAIDDLKAAVEAETSVVQSAVTLLNGLAQQIKDAVQTGNAAAVEEAANQILANTAALSAAVSANTPAAPATPAPGGTDTTSGGQDTTAGATGADTTAGSGGEDTTTGSSGGA